MTKALEIKRNPELIERKVIDDIQREIAEIKDFEVVNGGLYVREYEVQEIINKHIKAVSE